LKLLSNCHTHSNFCDGKDSPYEIARHAILLGMSDLGFSSHSYIPFDRECHGILNEAEYISEIGRLKEIFSENLYISCGIELDSMSSSVSNIDKKYDFIIQSVHYLCNSKGIPVSIDNTCGELEGLINDRYGGKFDDLAENYFQAVFDSVISSKADIVAHYDLITKFEKECALIDENSKRYRNTAIDVLDKIADFVSGYGGMFEVNTGAMARGYKTNPYPSDFLLKRLCERGARVIITSDSHSKENLLYGFDRALDYLMYAGFKSMAVFKKGRFVEVSI
jgi:histidinol-phosphatase (PHP family)